MLAPDLNIGMVNHFIMKVHKYDGWEYNETYIIHVYYMVMVMLMFESGVNVKYISLLV